MNRSIKSLVTAALFGIGIISGLNVAARAPSSPAECPRFIQMCKDGDESACLMVEAFCSACVAGDAQAKPLVAKRND